MRDNPFIIRCRVVLHTTIALLVCAPVSRHSWAQCPPIYTFTAPNPGELLGWSVAGIGDVNGDGIGDMALAAYNSSAGGPNSGAIYLRSGQDGSLIRTITGPPNSYIGYLVAPVGDVNNDGIPDLIATNRLSDGSSSATGIAIVFSGANGSILHNLSGSQFDSQFGCSVAAMGDLNNDGYDDFAVGAYFETVVAFLPHAGRVRVFSGIDGSVLYTIDGRVLGHWFGFAMSSMADINGDGCRELIVGAYDSQALATAQAFVLSGRDGAPIHEIPKPSPGLIHGARVVGVADVNGDGIADFAVTSNGLSCGLYVYSGGSGQSLYCIPINANTFADGGTDAPYPDPKICLATGNFNGDNHPDILFGDANFTYGKVFSIDGANGSITQRQVGLTGVPNTYFGYSVATPGDITGDGRDDIIIGAPIASGGAKVYVYRGAKLGDLDCSGTVNVTDLLLVINHWFPQLYAPCPPLLPGDSNSDCRVNANDLLEVINNWG